MTVPRSFFIPVIVLALFLSGCGGSSHTPSVLLVLDGPPLAIVVKSDAAMWKGTMDRSCMAGIGHIFLLQTNEATFCSGDIDQPASEKGRMYAELRCNNGESMTLVYRNLGPDQGMGIAKINEQQAAERAVLFYHPSPEEAERRLMLIEQDVAKAVELKK